MYCDSSQISTHLKKSIKIGEFCVVILILKMEENTQHFSNVMLYYFKKDKNSTEMQKKRKKDVQCMEKMLWLVNCVKSALQNHVDLGAERGLPWPHSLGSRKARCSSHAELSLSSLEDAGETMQEESGERTFAGGPREGATWFRIKNWR